MKTPILIYAPNINTGGGFVLLQSILDNWPEDTIFDAFLDARIATKITLPTKHNINWIKATPFSRIKSALKLKKVSCNYSKVLMFHGLPPVFELKPKVYVFIQNRLLLDSSSILKYPIKVAIRIFIERTISRLFKHNVDEYIVQTPSMARELIAWHGNNKKPKLVNILPFNNEITHDEIKLQLKWDLIYVSDGSAHKNHLRLINALVHLSKENIFPTLAITLGPRDSELLSKITQVAKQYRLNIHNTGHILHENVLEAIRSSGALIFPSKTESFGLPLIEAYHLGVPIIASELDYVRDVCIPNETFDPNSAISIARAIKRHLGITDSPVKVESALSFIQKVMN